MDSIAEKLGRDVASYLETKRTEGGWQLQQEALGRIQPVPLESTSVGKGLLSKLEEMSLLDKREVLPLDQERTVVLQGFGNGISYVHISSNKSHLVSEVYYLDHQSGLGIDLHSLDPNIKFYSGGSKLAGEWFASVKTKSVHLPSTKDNNYRIISDSDFRLLNLIAPVHEIGHVLGNFWSLYGLGRELKKISDETEVSKAISAAVFLVFSKNLPKEDKDKMGKLLTKFQSRKRRGSADERAATYFAFWAIRDLKAKGVDLLRNESALRLIELANRILHDKIIRPDKLVVPHELIKRT